MKNRFFRKPLCIVLILIVTLSMAACGSKTETATTPMDSFKESISEVGIWGASSSLKKHYKSAQQDGDIGAITITLASNTPKFYTSPWWVDEWYQDLTADTVVIAGNTGDYYTGTIECYKCGFTHNLDDEIGEHPFTITVKCDCSGNNHLYGVKKILTVSVIPIL